MQKNKIHIASELGESIGLLWQSYQNQHKSDNPFIVASPISNTPLPIYQWITANAKEFSHWDDFRFVLMDEQVVKEQASFSYIPLSDPASFENKIKQMFLLPVEKEIGIPISQSILKPDLGNLQDLDKEMAQHTGIDLLILAIGEEGHYAQVLPGTQKTVGFHVAELLESYKQKHQQTGTFSGSQFQQYGMSLGPKQVMSAKRIIVIISGEKKRELTKQLFSLNSFDPQFPLSIIYDEDIKDRVQIYITEDVLDEELQKLIVINKLYFTYACKYSVSQKEKIFEEYKREAEEIKKRMYISCILEIHRI